MGDGPAQAVREFSQYIDVRPGLSTRWMWPCMISSPLSIPREREPNVLMFHVQYSLKRSKMPASTQRSVPASRPLPRWHT